MRPWKLGVVAAHSRLTPADAGVQSLPRSAANRVFSELERTEFATLCLPQSKPISSQTFCERTGIPLARE